MNGATLRRVPRHSIRASPTQCRGFATDVPWLAGVGVVALAAVLLTGCGQQSGVATPPLPKSAATGASIRPEDETAVTPPWAATLQPMIREKTKRQRDDLAKLARRRPLPSATSGTVPAASTPTAAEVARVDAALARYAEAATPKVRQEILEQVAGVDDERVLPMVRQSLEDPEPAVRRAGLQVLDGIGGKNAAPLVAQALRDTSTDVRREAVYLIAAPAVQGEERQPLLATAIGDPEAAVRFAALDTVDILAPAERLVVLGQALSSTYRDVRTEALVLLQGENTPEARAAVTQALNTDDPDFKREVQDTLDLMQGRLQAPPADPTP